MSNTERKTDTPEVRGYAIAVLEEVRFGPEITEYLERIDATLAPYGGRFLVHGAEPVPLEGTWAGTPIVVEFPSPAAAREWYDSPAYRAILPLRTENSDGRVILVDGVTDDHRATDILV
ncbi:Uncharacterized conserved protein, DUF1330 family [Rhodococcus triatomae]|uniref:Uncharacterized conserved protein, DUF1330 family n=1 Tax=Rhodococcus triatomae TaxID=300028 RepID=A0A1G8SE01_9NOCA|nr:DUF1330 domain-containing protein [Rhodococcus triatomae]SDJ27489.1 Uncharacterized conserved protein, DUF1330 family [Rhodococcus triatomae]